jgi:hypothetical protein
VSKEADGATAVAPFFTKLSPVFIRMQPALIHSMRVWTAITLETKAAFVVRAWDWKVFYDTGITPSGILSGMGKRAGSPVVHISFAASCHLEMIHSK